MGALWSFASRLWLHYHLSLDHLVLRALPYHNVPQRVVP